MTGISTAVTWDPLTKLAKMAMVTRISVLFVVLGLKKPCAAATNAGDAPIRQPAKKIKPVTAVWEGKRLR